MPTTAILPGLLAVMVVPQPSAQHISPPDEIFVDVANQVGLDFVYRNGASGRYYFPEIAGGGAALLDYDGDGDLDLFLVQAGILGGVGWSEAFFPVAAGEPVSDRLFRNDLASGPDGEPWLRFTDVTAEAGLAAENDYGMGVVAADYDGDGWTDVYVTNFGSNRLWRNRGDGTFEDATRAAAVDDPRWTVAATFFDADLDGDLDLYVGTYVDYAIARNIECRGNSGRRDYCGPDSYPSAPDRLYLNRGDGSFADHTGASGLGSAPGAGLGAIAGDWTGDGLPDLYVTNDGEPNRLWVYLGEGGFRDEALFRGAAINTAGMPEASMGIDAADVDGDGDGDEDLLISHLERETHTLYRNDGEGFFTDRSAFTGLGPPNYSHTGFGASWIDFDNDGWLDLFVANGAVYAIERLLLVDDRYPFHEPDQLFRGRGDGRFESVGEDAGSAVSDSRIGRGVARGDLDNDGDVDLVVVDLNGPVRLLLNRAGSALGGWLGVRLVERATGDRLPDVPGAAVRVLGADGRRYHKIEVRLKRRGLKVRHRDGYRDKPIFNRMADAVLSSLRWGLERNELGLEIEFADTSQPSDSGEDRLVTMIVRIPMGGLVLVPRGDSYVGMVKLYVAVADTRSRVARPQEVPVPIRIPAAELETARERSWAFEIPLRMRPGSQRVVVGARDDLGATESFVGAQVSVAGP